MAEFLTAQEAAQRLRMPHMKKASGKDRRQPEREIVESLLKACPQVQRLRWKETVLKRLAEFDLDEMEAEGAAAVVKDISLIPDAFAIYPEEHEIHFFEVEITSLMSKAKLQIYAKMVTDLNTYGIELTVYTLNHHGHMNHVYLFPHYVEWLRSCEVGS